MKHSRQRLTSSVFENVDKHVLSCFICYTSQQLFVLITSGVPCRLSKLRSFFFSLSHFILNLYCQLCSDK